MANPIKVIKLTGVSGSLEGKADAIHTHVLSDITDAGTAAASSSADFATAAQGLVASSALQAADIDTLTELNANFTDGTILVDDADPRLSDDRNPLTHTHTLSDITDSGSAAALDVPTSGDATAAQVVKGDDSRLTGAAYAPVSHLHTLSEISDSGSAAALDVPASGNATAGQVVKGTDTRLIDARIPITHSHPESAISDLGTNIILESDIDIDAAGFVLDEDDLVSNSSTQLATQASIKAYVDNSTSTAMDYKGLYDPATNTPNLDASPTAGSISQGDTYTVLSATGQFYGTESLNEGDTLIATQDDPSLAAHWAVILSTQPDEIVGNLRYAADYDASAGAPPLNAPQGTTYRVSVAGLGLGFFSSLLPVDTLIIARIDSPVVEQDWLQLVPSATSITDLDEVSLAAVTDKFVLVADGTDYKSRLLVEADISDLGTYSTASSTTTFTNKTFDANGTGNSITNIDLTADVIGDLPYANLVTATTASKLVGRGSSSGGGDMQEISLGTGLTMSGTTISASGSAPSDAAYGASWNGDTTNAASKNAIYDKIETLATGGGGGTVQGSSVTYDILLASADGAAPAGTADKSVDLQAIRGTSTQTSKGVSSVISGGGNNSTDEAFAVVAGGSNNNNQSFAATISGGEYNQITGLSTQAAYSVIAGGRYNFIKSSSPASTVSGEYNEIDSSGKSSILGGKNNRITNSSYSTVSGGYGNLINTTSSGTRNVLGGGLSNAIQGSYGFIGGGQSNLITPNSSHTVIAGGNNNGTGSGYYGMTRCFIGAGLNNTMCGYGSFIGAGSGNDIDGFFGGSSNTSIVGGTSNSAYYASNSVVLGGRDCSLYYSNYTVMSGRRAKITVANKHGQFIYADDQDLDFVCNTERTANFRVANGMHISAPLFIDERASALADIAGRGQIWVKTATPNELWFTDDAGSDRPISESVYTVATLPTGVAGRRAFVTDSGNTLASHHGQVVTNGGANFVPVYHDGSAWHVG